MGRSRGVREERTEQTKLFSRTFAGSGLTKRRASRFSWFLEILEFQCTRDGPQNLPFCPGSPHNTFIFLLRYFKTGFFKLILLKSKIWKSGNLKVWKRRAPKTNRDLSSQKVLQLPWCVDWWQNRLQNRYLGTGNFAWELSHGNFCSRISGLGNWAPEAGGTAGRDWGNPGGPAPLTWSLRHWVRTLLGKPS